MMLSLTLPLWVARGLLSLLAPLVTTAFFNSARGQQPQVHFDRIMSEQGLPSPVVNSIMQDSRGFMWFGTMAGLCRYDGYDVKVFKNRPSDSTSLSVNEVWSLFEDNDGVIWVGTYRGGLNRFDIITERFTRFYSKPDSFSLPSNNVLTLLEDSRGTFWIGTYGGGLCTLDRRTGRFAPVQLDHGSPGGKDAMIRSIYEDRDGIMWFGTAEALFSLNPTTQKVSVVHNEPGNPLSLTDGRVGPILEDPSGHLWIGTTNGLNKMNKKTGIVTRYVQNPRDRQSITNNQIFGMALDHSLALWIGTLGGGLNRLNIRNGELESFRHMIDDGATLSDDQIRTLMIDDTGALWLGTTNGGVNKLNTERKQFRTISNKPGNPTLLHGGTVEAIIQDRAGTLWVGTETNGIFLLPEKSTQFQRVSLSPIHSRRLNNSFVTRILEDHLGVLWAATYGDGLSSIDPGTGRVDHYLPSNEHSSLASIEITNIFEDRSHFLWIATNNHGLDRFDRNTGRFSHYRYSGDDSTTLSDDRVRVILEDRFGILWIGTEGGGLSAMNKERSSCERFRHNPLDSFSLSSELVYSLHEDALGRLWVGTANGLNLFQRDSKSFHRFFNDADRASNYFLAINSDTRGRLWLNTQSGLVRFDPHKKEFNTYNKGDGVQGNEFSNASFRNRAEEILVGGKNGISIFHPDSIRNNTLQPRVALTEFKVFEKPFPLDSSLATKKSITLAYDQNIISFAFSALDFTNPAENTFAYKMEGFDDQWIYIGRRSYATFTNLDPGSYVFRIRAANNDGVWNEAGTSIALSITPPFWETFWFRTLVVLSALGVIVLLYKYRVRQLLAIERMRVRIASDLHDDIGSSLGSIALLSDMVRSKSHLGPTENQQLSEISKSARLTAEALRDIVWVINPEHDKIDNLVLRMRDAANSMVRTSKVNFYCHSEKLAHVVDMEFRRNILLIYKEILHNIVKHASADNVDVFIDEQDSQFHLTIRDDGIGFDISAPTEGHGMKTLHNRAEKLGGSFHIETAVGNGTTVVVTAKIP